MIGIERWGQRRLKITQGEPFLDEEYSHYRPSSERNWEELRDDWDATRRGTIALAQELAKIEDIEKCSIIHNQYGPLSVKGWLRYLDVHARSEVKHIK